MTAIYGDSFTFFFGLFRPIWLHVESIIKLRIDQEKAKGLNVFNSQPAINDIIISEDVYQAIKRNKFDIGLEFVLVGF